MLSSGHVCSYASYTRLSALEPITNSAKLRSAAEATIAAQCQSTKATRYGRPARPRDSRFLTASIFLLVELALKH